jgi:xanthine/CO dehydrogenase XdhC/CoxF family maturation factor
MTHELKQLVEQALQHQDRGLKSVMATVVALNGSSYRKPGVRMLICEDGQMTGAVSGGCVERDVYEEAKTVFKTGIPKVMTYDGRYRLGCEGLLFILIEPVWISAAFKQAFSKCLQERKGFSIRSYFQSKDKSFEGFGTHVFFSENAQHPIRADFVTENSTDLEVFEQSLEPRFQLYVFGGEHDAVKLCSMACLLGWEVHIVCSVKDPKSTKDFPGASSVTAQVPELVEFSVDSSTAVVLMNHNYAQDLKCLLQLEAPFPKYIGVLGSRKRREKLVNDLFTHKPDFDTILLDRIYSPAGLDIGSITPEEIGLSILAEVLAIYRGKAPASLRAVSKTSLSS